MRLEGNWPEAVHRGGGVPTLDVPCPPVATISTAVAVEEREGERDGRDHEERADGACYYGNAVEGVAG